MLNLGGFEKKDDDLGLDLLINPKKVSGSPRGSPLASDDEGGPIVTIHKKGSDADSFDDDDSESEIRVINASDASSESSDWRGPAAGRPAPAAPATAPISFAAPTMTAEDILNTKRELLYQFNRLEKKGMALPRKFSLSSSLEEMKAEYERLKRDMEIDASVRFQRRMLMACVSGVEFLNHKFDPFSVHLDGWSETVQENINDYDDVFEELWDKYHTKVKMAPELRLMFMLGGSAVWFHISHSMFKTMPGVDQVFRQNPELKRQFMDATMKTMQQQDSSANGASGGGGGGLFGGLGNLMGGLFGGGNNAGGVGAAPAPSNAFAEGERPNMRGPTDVDDLLNELQQERFNRTDDFEIFSNASGLTGVTDDPLTSVLLEKSDKKGKRRRTLDL